MAAEWLVAGSGLGVRVLGGGRATTTSATGAASHRSAGRPGPRTGGRSRCRKARSPLVVGDAGRVRCARRPGRRRQPWPGSPTGTRSASSGPGAHPGRTAPWWPGRLPPPPSGTRPPAPGGQRQGGRAGAAVQGQRSGVQVAADEQPAGPAGRRALSRQLHLRPGIPAFALGAITGVDGQPALRRDACGQQPGRCGRPVGHLERLGAPDGQHIRHPVGLQPGAQAGLPPSTSSAVTQAAGTPAARARASITLASSGLVANPSCSGTPAAARRSGSAIQPLAHTAPDQRPRADRAGVDQVDRDLGVVDLAAGAGVLASHPTVAVPFLQSPLSSTTSTP
jgi:hypothetical protein